MHQCTYAGKAKGKGELAKIQVLFNGWVVATGRPLGQISMILAVSVA